MCKNENDLILHCLKSFNAPENNNQSLSLLEKDLNWHFIYNTAKKEGVLNFIYYHLNSIDYLKEQLELFRNNYHNFSVINTIMEEETKKVIHSFKQNSIDIIGLKGIFLTKTIYNNIPLRTYEDLDILIKKEQLKKVNDILNGLGYKAPKNYLDVFTRTEISSINALMYIKEGKMPSFIHVHWHLINSTFPLDYIVRSININEIWDNAIPFNIKELPCLSLSVNHLLLFLCVHAFKHAYDRLILLIDIKNVLNFYKNEIDWDLFKEDCIKYKLSPFVYKSLSLTSTIFKIKIPVADQLLTSENQKNMHIFNYIIDHNSRSEKDCYRIHLLMQKGFFKRISFFLKTVFPSKYVMALIYMQPASKISIFHYLRRLIKPIIYRFKVRGKS